MQLKFNNGRGAILCDHCKVIIMENLKDYEWLAFCELDHKGAEWFCEKCQPNSELDQAKQLIETINNMDIKILNKNYKKFPRF
jgi:transcription initiation factor TFIIIB Brf1 subunit/transcription initiation factor TFIIB